MKRDVVSLKFVNSFKTDIQDISMDSFENCFVEHDTEKNT